MTKRRGTTRIIVLAPDIIRLSGLELGRHIEIQLTGPRPGEKLHEELHARSESHSPTHHPKITIVDRRPTELPWQNTF